MKIFFAGTQGFERTYPEIKPYLKHRLVSYHYMTPSLDKFFMSERDESLVMEDLIMDSGAFSAWSQGLSIDFEDYIRYCLRHLEHIDYVVNLDVIPAKPGQKSISQEEIERSASGGWRNAQRMLRSGVPKEKLIHVFHQNENFKWLERMVQEFDYIGLSPANDRTTAEKMIWLDQCMPYVTDSTGAPTIKFHGFAVTAHSLMMRYPWFSVDSASWCQQSGRGVVWIPPFRNTEPVYDEMPYSVRIGNNSPFEKEAVHFNNHPPKLQALFLKYLESKGHVLGESSCRQLAAGEKKGNKGFLRFCRKRKGCNQVVPPERCVEEVVVPGIINKYGIRAVVNAQYICDLEDSMVPWPNKNFNIKLLRSNGFNF